MTANIYKIKINWLLNNISKTVSHILGTPAIVSTLLVVTSCQLGEEQKEVSVAAENFGNAFFNYNYRFAQQLSTPESMKWIKFVASNLTQDDLNAINATTSEAVCATQKVNLTSDTTATVCLDIQNASWIATEGMIIDEGTATTQLNLRKRDGTWQVHLTEIPQIEYNRK